MKTDTSDGVIAILFVTIAVLVGAAWASGRDKESESPSKPVQGIIVTQQPPSVEEQLQNMERRLDALECSLGISK